MLPMPEERMNIDLERSLRLVARKDGCRDRDGDGGTTKELNPAPAALTDPLPPPLLLTRLPSFFIVLATA
jgi:hypothetical protein